MNDARPWALYAGGKDKTMFDEFKPGDVIAEEKFRVTLPDDGTVIHYTVTLEKSGAFAYGNQTCVGVHNDYPGQMDRGYDTRYVKECSTVEGFRKWAFDFLKRDLRPDVLIEREKPTRKKQTRRTYRKEYGVHFKSNDGKEEHIGGHYTTPERAATYAEKCRRNGNRDVYIVVRNVTAWERNN